jgi:hypothetical protein
LEERRNLQLLFSRIQRASGMLDEKGRSIVKIEQILQASCSIRVGNWKFQGKQWSPPKSLPPIIAPSSAVSKITSV